MIKQLLVALMMFGITSAKAEVIKVKFQLDDGTTIQKQYPLKFKQDTLSIVPGFACSVGPRAEGANGAFVLCLPKNAEENASYAGSIETFCESTFSPTKDKSLIQILQYTSISRGTFVAKDEKGKLIGVSVRVGCVDETINL